MAHFLKLCRGWSRTPRIFESQISDHYLPLVVSRNSYVIKYFFPAEFYQKDRDRDEEINDCSHDLLCKVNLGSLFNGNVSSQ